MADTTLVLMGRTGNGKSATGNSILGRNAFHTNRSFRSVTKACKLEQTRRKDGRKLNVVDTPGLFDTNASKAFIGKEIVKCIDLAKDGVHAVLLVLSTKNRFTEEEADVIDNLQMLFGPRIVNYMVIVFTGGDELENDGITLEEFLDDCPQHLKGLVDRCNSRTILFNNKTSSEIKKEKQVTRLLKLTDSIIAENGSQPYSNELFTKAQAMAAQLFNTQDKENAHAEQVKRLNEMMEQNMRIMEDKIQKITKKMEEALSSKEKSNEKNRKLREELNQTRKILASVRNPKCKTSCSIL